MAVLNGVLFVGLLCYLWACCAICGLDVQFAVALLRLESSLVCIWLQCAFAVGDQLGVRLLRCAFAFVVKLF